MEPLTPAGVVMEPAARLAATGVVSERLTPAGVAIESLVRLAAGVVMESAGSLASSSGVVMEPAAPWPL